MEKSTGAMSVPEMIDSIFMLRVPLQTSFAPHPLALLATSFATGILAAHFIALHVSVLLVLCALCSLLVIYFLSRRHLGLCTLLFSIAFLLAGATLAILEKGSVAANRVKRFYESGQITSGDPVEVTGVIELMPETAPDGFYLTLRVEKLRAKEQEQDASGVVQLFAIAKDVATRAEYEELELRYGARVRVMVALERAQRFRNPGVAQFTEYLERRGFDATATIKSPLLVERLDDERVFLPLAMIYEWRARLVSLIGAKFSTETAGVLNAALLGNRNYLSRDTSERFREGGTFHVLVISGLHISFIGGLIMLIARLITKKRAWQFSVSCAFLWAYTFAVGAEASVVRAALMFTVVALAPVLSRRANSINALGGAAIALLVLRPSDLFDPSFQLTFLSVLMIVALAWPLTQKLREIGEWHPTHETPYPPVCPRWFQILGEILFWSERRWRREMARSAWSYNLFKTPLAARLERLHLQRLLRYAFVAMTVSVSVQLGLLPLLVLYFHRLSFASLILNIWVSALMATLALVALLALALSQLSAGAFAAPLIQLAEKLNWIMVHSVDLFQRIGIASIRLPEYTGWASAIYILYYLPLAILIFALARFRPLRRE
ncbi:MAG: ComEC/Rec2 family competence protein, partial [Pyrinomonadaceae bacterium]